ncbi:MAG TPA: hypothetical protein VEU76_10275 [Candidatus Udaeobacter sp.]|nr:hypothetical protein [Candidatus Udaeobacter sp.]
MTGEPAETWRKFTFSSLRWLPLVLLPLGVVGHAAIGLMERRASGRLPLTQASKARLRRAGWQGLVLMLAAFGSFGAIAAIGVAAGPHAFNGPQSDAAGFLLFGGLLALIGGTLVLLIARYLVGPRGVVRPKRAGDKELMVEIWNVHPAFVAAFDQMQQNIRPGRALDNDVT